MYNILHNTSTGLYFAGFHFITFGMHSKPTENWTIDPKMAESYTVEQLARLIASRSAAGAALRKLIKSNVVVAKTQP